MKAKTGIAMVGLMALTLCAGTASANTVASSTMHFEGTLTDAGSGVYTGSIAMTVGEYYVPGGLGASISTGGGFDVYGKDGGCALVQNYYGDGVWNCGGTGSDQDDTYTIGYYSSAPHDGYPDDGGGSPPWGSYWNPDCADYYNYQLTLTAGQWHLYYNGGTLGSPVASPMSGIMDWANMYASENDIGAYVTPYPGGYPFSNTGDAEVFGAGAGWWDVDWSWGSDAIPLELAGFNVEITLVSGSTYHVTLTPARGPLVVAAGWDAFIIRENATEGAPYIWSNDNHVPDAVEMVIFASGQKAGLGTDSINGATVSQISTLHIDRLDDIGASGSLYGPYFNIWVTDGLGNYAVIANEPSDGEWAGSRWDVPDWDFLKTKRCKVYETTGSSGGQPGTSWVATYTGMASDLIFENVAGLIIEPPPVAYILAGNGIGSGAPDELDTNVARGFNWIFGDTSDNYVSGGGEGFVVDGYAATANFPVRNITQGTGYNLIQPAIDAANSGDTITVAAGTYDEYLSVNEEVSIIGAGVSQVTIDVSGLAGSNSSGIYVSADNVTLQGFTLQSNGSNPPRYGIKFGEVDGCTLEDVTVRDVYRSGIDALGSSDLTITNVTSQDNGGHGLSLVDCNGVTVTNVSFSGNGWQNVSVATWGHYSPLGTSGIVFAGTNSFGDLFQLEMGDYNNPGVAPTGDATITYSTTDPLADVLVQASDFGFALHGEQDDSPDQVRIWFFSTLANAAQVPAYPGPVGHWTGNAMYIESLTDGTQLYATPGCSIQAAIDAADPGDTINVSAGTYTEALLIQKEVTLLGATAGVNKNGYTVPAGYAWDNTVESIINHPDPAGGYTTIVDIYDTDNVTFDGFVVQELNADANKNSSLLRVYAHTREITNINVVNNIIGPNTATPQDGTDGRMGLYIVNHPYDDKGVVNSSFAHNKIFDCKGNGNNVFLWTSYYSYGAPGPASMAGTVIEDNEIYGSHRSGIETAGGFADLTIRNNTIYGNSGLPGDTVAKLKYGHGILLIRGSGDKISDPLTAYGPVDLLIEGNEIYGNEKSGIYMGPKNDGITIDGNIIRNNGWDGIMLDLEGNFWNPTFESPPASGQYACYDCSTNVTAVNNAIYGNGTAANPLANYGVQVFGVPTNAFVLNAINNWWGDASGPYDPAGTTEVLPCTGDWSTDLNDDGLGDEVTDYVDYCAWLDSYPRLTLEPDQECYEAGDTVCVEVWIRDISEDIVGGQFFVDYDTNYLTLATGDPAAIVPGDAPMSSQVFECSVAEQTGGVCTPTAGEIGYAVGVPIGSPDSVTGDWKMAVMCFTAEQDICSVVDLLTWRNPPVADTRLTTTPFGLIYPTPVTLSIADTTPPTIDPPAGDLTVECDGLGNATELTDWLAGNGGAGASDNCGSITWANDFIALSDDCGATGSATVTFTATDHCDNFSTTVATFTIADTTPPTIDPPAGDLTVECDGLGNATELADWLANNGGASASDVCGGVAWSYTPNPATLSDLCGATGAVTVTFRATDDCTNYSETTATFTIADNVPPVITGCPGNITVNADAGSCSAVVTWTEPTADDTCGMGTLVSDWEPGDTFPQGTTTVTYTATDDCGNETLCTFDVTVEPNNDLLVNVELQWIDTAVTRCIKFTFTNCTTMAEEVLYKDIDFDASGMATNVLFTDLPCGEYDCVTAEDELHTLQVRLDSAPDFDIVGTQYVADFTGTNKLTSADYFNDELIDIADFGVFVAEWGACYDSDSDTICDGNTPCAYTPPTGYHADANGDGVLDVSDFNPIAGNFLMVGDSDCCVTKAAGSSEPRDAIMVRELHKLGVPNARRADLNRDGWIDMEDIQLFLNGEVPDDLPELIPTEQIRTIRKQLPEMGQLRK